MKSQVVTKPFVFYFYVSNCYSDPNEKENLLCNILYYIIGLIIILALMDMIPTFQCAELVGQMLYFFIAISVCLLTFNIEAMSVR